MARRPGGSPFEDEDLQAAAIAVAAVWLLGRLARAGGAPGFVDRPGGTAPAPSSPAPLPSDGFGEIDPGRGNVPV